MRILTLILLVFATSTVHGQTADICPAPEAEPVKPRQDLAEIKLEKRDRDPALYVSPGWLYRRMDAGQSVVIADVRGREAFERVHIRGARNVALAAVKTKRHWRDRALVLVGSGQSYRPLEQAARELRAKGFDAHVLDGGVAYWARMVRDRTQGSPGRGELFSVEPRVALAERGSSLWTVVDRSGQGVADDYFRHVVEQDEGTEDSALTGQGSSGELLSHVLVVTGTGGNQLLFDPSNRAFQDSNVFVLEGGVQALQEFLVSQRRMKAGKQRLSMTQGGCG